jgi:PAS domain S-box-containing protein
MRVAFWAAEGGRLRELSAEVGAAGHPVTVGALGSIPESAPAVLVVDAATPELGVHLEAFAMAHPKTIIMGILARGSDVEVPALVSQLLLLPLEPGDLMRHIGHAVHHASLVRREDLLAKAVESAGDIIEISDRSLIPLYVNPAFTEILGYEPDEVLGQPPATLIRDGLMDIFYFAQIEQSLAAGRVWSGMLKATSKDGRQLELEATYSPVLDAEGELRYCVAVKRDITDRLLAERKLKQTNEELSRARDDANLANHAKSQFLANMSHELRTPLNAILGYSELLMEEVEELNLEEDIFSSDLKRISDAGKHLLALINDVLDISKIEAGKMDLYFELFDVKGMVTAVCATVQNLFEESGNQLRVEYENEPTVMTSDLTKVRQTLLNLLSNANKFTDKGEVVVRVRREVREDETWMVFEVQDTGIGMSDEQRERLFRPFVQAEASITRRFGGTGLGLALCRRFCDMLGGSITVESELGKGSTFRFSLPNRRELGTMRPPPVSPEG